MFRETQMVRDFHKLIDVPCDQQLPLRPNNRVWSAGWALAAMARDLEQHVADCDLRYVRAHLMIEELGEHLMALAMGQEEESVDGLADLLYVVLGTAVTYNWPIAHLFREVHRSNMTKQRANDDPGRCRDKGSAFERPRITGVLAGDVSCLHPDPVTLDVGEISLNDIDLLKKIVHCLSWSKKTHDFTEHRLDQLVAECEGIAECQNTQP